MEGEDYYSSLARRVYFIAEVEDWDYHTTVKMLNDKEGFERFYENVSATTKHNPCLITTIFEFIIGSIRN